MPVQTLSALNPLAKALIMRNALKPRWPAMGLGLMLSVAVVGQVQAQEWDLNIPSQSLEKALQALAAQTNVQLLYNANDVQGLRSTSVNGHYGLDQSINILLQGTGVRYQISGSTLTVLGQYKDALELSSVTISGKAPGSITEGTGSYTTGSTSSSTRLNLTPKETPQSITVMTRQRMDDQRLEDLVDVLNATTGVFVEQSNVGQDSPTIMARGSSINSFQIDGVPTSSLLGNELHDTAVYDRVEIVRGATGMMNGLGKPSATVNLIRKRPTFDPQASFTAEAGTWDRYGGGVDVSGPLNETGSARGRVVVDYKNQHAWVDRYEQESLVLYGIGEFDISDNTLLTLGFNRLTKNNNSQFRAMPLFFSNGESTNLSPSDFKWAKWLYYDQTLSNAFASIEHTFDSGWSGKAELSYTQNKYDAIITNVRGSIDQATGTGATLWPGHWKSNPAQVNLDVYATGPFSLFGREHELIAGFTSSSLKLDGPSYELPADFDRSIPNYYNWLEDTAKPDFVEAPGNKRHDIQNSAYLSSRFHLTDSTTFILGSRVTDWKRNIEYETYKVNSQENGVFTPYAGIVQDLNDTWSVYASYTKIFQPQEDYVIEYNGTPLQPEEGVSYETGVKTSFNEGRINASLAVFKNEQKNLAIWDILTDRYEVSDSATTKGVELELNGELTDGWNFSTGYSYSTTHDATDERILMNVPQHNIKTFTTYRLPGALNNMTIGGGVNWQSEIGEDNYRQADYAIANLMARYQFNKNLSGAANLNNLFNKEYYTTVNSSYAFYGPPRNVMFSLKYSY